MSAVVSPASTPGPLAKDDSAVCANAHWGHFRIVNPTGTRNPGSATPSHPVTLLDPESKTRFHMSFSYVFAAHKRLVGDSWNRMSMATSALTRRIIVLPPDGQDRQQVH